MRSTSRQLVLVVCLSLALGLSDEGCCGKTISGVCIKCCASYYLDSGMCYVCQTGRWGVNCSKTCSYPYFGSMCRETCQCDERLCHKITGCPREKNSNESHSHLQVTFIAGGSALGFCILTIISLIIMLCRKKQIHYVPNVNSQELQLFQNHVENLEQKTLPVEMNKYRDIRSVMGESSDNQPYEEIEDYMPMDTIIKKDDLESHETKVYHSQGLGTYSVYEEGEKKKDCPLSTEQNYERMSDNLHVSKISEKLYFE